jgi:hypothetical protein
MSVGLKEIGYEIQLAEVRDQWRTHVATKMDLRIP